MISPRAMLTKTVPDFIAAKAGSADQVRRCVCPRTTDCDKLALTQQVMQSLGGFQARKTGWRCCPCLDMTARADDAHSYCRA